MGFYQDYLISFIPQKRSYHSSSVKMCTFWKKTLHKQSSKHLLVLLLHHCVLGFRIWLPEGATLPSWLSQPHIMLKSLSSHVWQLCLSQMYLVNRTHLASPQQSPENTHRRTHRLTNMWSTLSSWAWMTGWQFSLELKGRDRLPTWSAAPARKHKTQSEKKTGQRIEMMKWEYTSFGFV